MTKSSFDKKNEDIHFEKVFQYGVMLYQHNKREEARDVFEKLLAEFEHSSKLHQVLAIMDNQDGSWKKALSRLNHALNIEPNNPSILFDKASILVEQGFNNEAKAIIETLLSIAPNNADILALKQKISSAANIKSHLVKNIDSETKKEIEQTLSFAEQMKNQGNDEQAKMLFQAVLSISDNQADALLGLARLQIKEKNFALAKQSLLRGYDKKKPSKEVLVLLSHCEINMNEFKSAKEYCKQGIKTWSSDPIFYQMLILSYEKAQNWLEAYKYGKEFIQRFPENQDLLNRFAIASFMQLRDRHNFTQEAILACENILQKAIQNAEEKRVPLLSTFLAKVLWYKGEAKLARDLLETYLKKHPDDMDVAFHTCFIYKSLEQWKEYYQSFEQGFASGDRLRYYGKLPTWNLSRPKDDTVLVLPEQGVGDEIYYFHNLNIVLKNAKEVYVVCDLRLEPIVNRAFTSANVIPIKRKNNQKMDIPLEVFSKITSWIAMGSLAKICFDQYQRHLYQTSYLEPDEKIKEKIKLKLAKLNPNNKKSTFIGICWRSSLAASTRNMHYLNIEELAYFVQQLKDIIFINLQYDDCAKELKKIEKISKVKIHQIDGIDLKNDFVATAALISSLNVVFTAGTAIHRLTNALGVTSHAFFAGNNDSNFTKPRHTNSSNQIEYYYPPMLENKRPMLDFIAKSIEQNI